MEDIPIQLLNSFVIFNDSKNIIEAANRLGISQPGLSKQLKQLEQQLPDRIFTIRGRKKSLTPFGKELHRRIKSRIGNLQREIEVARILHTSPNLVTLRIAARRGILDRISSKLKFTGGLIFEESSSDGVLHSLQHMKADIGITHTLMNSHELIAKPLFVEQFQLVIPKTLCANRPEIGSELCSQLLELPCLGYGVRDKILETVFWFYSVSPEKLRIVRATENYLSLLDMVEANLGWTILPKYLRITEKSHWTIPLPASAVPTRRFHLVYRAEFSRMAWFQELVSEMRACFS
jgi:DNA-binding transcriptional LysR family regulator